MKRKLTAVILATLLVLTLFPAVAGAEEEPVQPLAATYALDVTVNGTGSLDVKIGEAAPVTVDGSQQFDVDEGAQVTLMWNAEEGSYLDVLSVGGTDVPAGEGEYADSYTFTMDQAKSVTATFTEYAMVSFDVSIKGPGVLHMLENGVWGGVAPMEDSIEVQEGSTLTFRASAKENGVFAGAYVNGQPVEATPAEDGGYQFEVENVREHGSIEVVFTEMASIDVDIEGPGSLFMLENGKWFGVAGGEGSISVPVGSTATFRAYPDEDASFLLAVVNGQPVNATETGDGGYEFQAADLRENGKVEVAFLGAIDIGVLNQDEATGIKYFLPSAMVTPGSNITPDSLLQIGAVTGGDAYEAVKAAVARFGTVFTAYDITLVNSSGAYQPNVPVFLGFPLPDGYSTNPENLHVVHVAADGSGEEMPFELETGEDGKNYLTVEATSFSVYAIVDSSQAAAADTPGNKAPKTGDTENMMLFLVLAAVSAGLIGCTVYRKVKNGKAQ
ncbi:hypothetical protein [Christensenella intestinihominis]|uniref:hypothetical protein n=1 Tax=Christensenella intestinihominis TaxID=1851429 RepID=UPI00082ECEE7|nr:hypothetical protein [Christensenella intestinihominis]